MLQRALLFVLLLAPSAAAQWSSDAAENLAVADGDATQVQPKAVSTIDGGTYISWFEGDGFDVRVQLLGVDGNPVFPDGGVLVADRGFSSTQDYGLSTDTDGNALLAFRDDRGGGTNVTAVLVTAVGAQPWGADGVRLTATTDFIGAPKIAGTSDGGAMVAWSQNGTAHLQKLDASGAPQWTSDVVLTAAAGFYFTSDLQATGTDAILSLVNQTGGGSAPRYLVAQKFDASGAPLWGADPVVVYDGGSLQNGNFPTFVTDGAGGGVFSWYSTARQCFVQRILADGTEAFASDGVEVSTAAGERVAPDVAFDAASETISVFWVELADNQNSNGVFGQAVDASGARLWTDGGVAVSPIGPDDVGQVKTVVGDAGSYVYWDISPAFGQDQLRGGRVSDGGNEVLTFDVSTTPSSKSRIAAVNNALTDFAVVVWQDDRAGNDDIYAQNVNPDGSLVFVSSEGEAPTAALALRAWPNPADGPVRFDVSLREPGTAALAVYDVLGRQVWSQAVQGVAGSQQIAWDGRDATGALVASGAYIARLTADGASTSVRLSVVR